MRQEGFARVLLAGLGWESSAETTLAPIPTAGVGELDTPS